MGSYTTKSYLLRPVDFRCRHDEHGILGDNLSWCKQCGALITPNEVHVPVMTEPHEDIYPRASRFRLSEKGL